MDNKQKKSFRFLRRKSVWESLRVLIMQKAGHPGGSLSAADVLCISLWQGNECDSKKS